MKKTLSNCLPFTGVNQPWLVLLGLSVLIILSPANAMANTSASDHPKSDNHAITLTASTEANAELSSEELLAIGQIAGHHSAIDNTVLNNKAIQDIGNTNLTHTNKDNLSPAPITSSQPAIASNQLILNQPVIDEANILTTNEKQQLSNKLRAIYTKGLAQAAIVLVPTTNGIPVFDYAMSVADKWQLGNKDIDNGLLILVSVNDRDMYILTGYGLEGVLTDVAVSRIIRQDITPLFKQNDYAGGLMTGINSLEQRLSSDPDTLAQADKLAEQQAHQQNEGNNIDPIFVFFIFLFFGKFITAIFGRLLGSSLLSGVFFFLSINAGSGLLMSVVLAVFLWIFLMGGGNGSGGSGGRGRRKGRNIIIPSGGGGFGGGGFGSGGSGGFGGGGGSFGGGGAGGSW